MRRLLDRLARAVAWALPRRVAYWCAVRVAAHATTGEHGHEPVPEVTAMEALQRWTPVLDARTNHATG